MTDDLIIQQLQDKEQRLLHELNKVRLAIQAFTDDIANLNPNNKPGFEVNVNIPVNYDNGLSYGAKILYILTKSGRPMLVDEIADDLHALEPGLVLNKIHKSVSYNVSMLAKYGRVKKHPFNRKIKYSIAIT